VLAQDARDRIDVIVGGVTYSIATARPRKGRPRPDEDEEAHFENGIWLLRSPQTGSVVDIRVALGDRVEQGAILMVVEAMKMQNELLSRVAGSVSAIKADKGQRVENGSVLMEISAPPGEPP